MDHFSCFREILDEPIETPHEIIGHSVKAATLDIYNKNDIENHYLATCLPVN